MWKTEQRMWDQKNANINSIFWLIGWMEFCLKLSLSRAGVIIHLFKNMDNQVNDLLCKEIPVAACDLYVLQDWVDDIEDNNFERSWELRTRKFINIRKKYSIFVYLVNWFFDHFHNFTGKWSVVFGQNCEQVDLCFVIALQFHKHRSKIIGSV